MLSNVPGVLHEVTDVHSLVAQITSSEIEHYLTLVQGRMKVKMIAAREALAGGVRRVILGDGRAASPVCQVLAGVGTVLTAVN